MGHSKLRGRNSKLLTRKVLEHAPCSVGVLVDRGLGEASHISARKVSSSVTVIFLGGQDDREALVYGVRMAEHPKIQLTVLHFSESRNRLAGESTAVDISIDSTAERKQADGKVLDKFKTKSQNDEAVRYEERVVASREESVSAIPPYSYCNLFLVGRSPEGAAAALMTDRYECPELGPMGCLLTSPNFYTTASVLVVQQYSACSVELPESQQSEGNE